MFHGGIGIRIDPGERKLSAWLGWAWPFYLTWQAHEWADVRHRQDGARRSGV